MNNIKNDLQSVIDTLWKEVRMRGFLFTSEHTVAVNLCR